MISVVLRKLLNETKNIDFTSVGTKANSRQSLLVCFLKFADEVRSKLDELSYRIVAVANEVVARLWPNTDVHGIEVRLCFLKHSTNSKRIEITVAVSDVPKMLKKWRLVSLRLTQQQLTR